MMSYIIYYLYYACYCISNMYLGYLRFFLACDGEPRFVGRRPTRVWPKAEDTSRKDLTETGNRARKASDTQGKITHVLVTKRHKLAIEKEGAGALQEIPQVLY